MGIRLQTVIVCAFSLGICTGAAERAPGGIDRLGLVVLLDDEVHVPQVVREGASLRTGRIFGQIGVDIEWLDPQTANARRAALIAAAADRAFLKALHVVRLRAPASTDRPASPARALGVATLGTRVATVFYSRVEQRARENGADVALLLGHVIAHELGHLLLRDNAHAAAGLMQERLDMQRAQQGRLLFTQQQAQAIRARLSADRYFF